MARYADSNATSILVDYSQNLKAVMIAAVIPPAALGPDVLHAAPYNLSFPRLPKGSLSSWLYARREGRIKAAHAPACAALQTCEWLREHRALGRVSAHILSVMQYVDSDRSHAWGVCR